RGNLVSEVKRGITWSLTNAYVALLFGIVGLTIILVAFKAAHSLSASVKSAETLIRSKGMHLHMKGEEATPEGEPADDEKKEGAPLGSENSDLDVVVLPSETQPPISPAALFATLGESSALAVASFLANQPAQKAVEILSLLRPDTSGAVLEILAPTFRAEVLKTLGGNFNVSDEQKETLAEPLGEFVRSFVHGPTVLVEIFEGAPEAVQTRIAQDLAKTAPRLLAEVEEAVMRADDLWALPTDQWITLATEISAEELAAAIQEAPSADRDRLTAALPGDLAKLVSQHLKLGGVMAPAKVVQARRKLFTAARALRQSGKITITRVARA
ncbi:MAG: hypothetical protein KBD85_04395, partial [Elusimicrobia bacterium]|nr:hypothetical protein [Elusimicrobiota bacterium]